MTHTFLHTDRLAQWIEELEHSYSQSQDDQERRFLYLLEGMISQAPHQALQFLQKHKEEGISSHPALPPLVEKLAGQLLSLKETGLVEELLHLGAEWPLRIDGTIPQQLARLYMQGGHLVKARKILEESLARAPQNPHLLRTLYELAKREGQTEEAHILLTQWVQADFSPATVMLAYRERTRLPIVPGRLVRIALLSSYVLDQLIPYLDIECRKVSLVPEFYIGPFQQYTQEILQPSSALYAFQPEIIFLALALEDLFPEITGYPSLEELQKARQEILDQILMLTQAVQQQSHALLVLHEFTLVHRSPHGILDNRIPNGLTRWVEDLNHMLAEELRTQGRAHLLPLNQVVSWTGKAQSQNPKMRYMASMRLGEAVLPELARYSMRFIKPLKGLTRKCVVLDLDGTLWGGIAGEVGPEGIHLGPTAPGIEYMDFQKALRNLTRRGILLAICSKNNPEDALPVIRNHPYMLLREEDFSAIRINWQNKADNLQEIAEELNIGLDALVFIDDNPNERELVRQLLPEVLTVELPTDPSRYRMTLEDLSDFELLAITKEDEKRVAQYQTMRQRRALRSSTSSLEDYLHSLAIQVDIKVAEPEALPRLVQMFNKTNQFNLTTRRYQSADITCFLQAKDYKVYTMRVSDRFGDHGITGAAIIQKDEEYWTIDSFLMSCRVMGLSVETAFLSRIYQDADLAGIKTLVGIFIPTQKNKPVKEFYAQHGFCFIKDTDGQQRWELDMKSQTVKCPPWVTITGV